MARTPLRVDARSQGRRGPDLGRGSSRERDRVPLLGKPLGKLRRRSDPRLERRTTIRRERPVGERSQLRDLLTAIFVFSTTSHRHGNTKGNSDHCPASCRSRRKAGARRARRSPVRSSLRAPTRMPSEPLRARDGYRSTAQKALTLWMTPTRPKLFPARDSDSRNAPVDHGSVRSPGIQPCRRRQGVGIDARRQCL